MSNLLSRLRYAYKAFWKEKIILAVEHRDEAELLLVKDEVIAHKPRAVWLELPTDYTLLQKRGVGIFFFSPLATHLSERGISIVPLQEPSLQAHSSVLWLAYTILMCEEGKYSSGMFFGKAAGRDELRAEIGRLAMGTRERKPLLAPELALPYEYLVKKYRTVLDIVESTPSADDLRGTITDIVRKNDEHMLGRIVSERPSVIVVGTGHAEALAKKLPNYKFIRAYD